MILTIGTTRGSVSRLAFHRATRGNTWLAKCGACKWKRTGQGPRNMENRLRDHIAAKH